MVKTFNQAVKFIEQYIPTPDKKHPGELGLKRMQYLMELLGNPQLKYPTVHVGGTSGKGSTATIIASILSTKYKVGLHTSPHLVKITERIKILSKRASFWGLRAKREGLQNHFRQDRFWTSQNDISNVAFVDLLNKIIPVIKKVEKSELGAPSYFEIVTAMAFLYFSQQKVDIAVIEVGMGGRFDATNVIQPLVVVLTNVGLDHTEILGDTVEKIAEDKVGIIKSGSKVVTGVTQTTVIDVVKRKALSVKRKGKDNNLSLLGRDFNYKIKSIGEEGSVFDYKGERIVKNLKLRLLGEHQVENASLAIKVVELLYCHSGERLRHQNRFWTSQNDLEKSIRSGLLSAFIPGRLEIIKKKPLVILDGAHNPDKVKALISSIKTIFPKRDVITIIAIKNDKNAKEMLTQLLKISYKVIFTKFQLTGDVGIINSYDPKDLLIIAQSLQHRYASRNTKVVKNLSVVGYVEKALEDAKESAKPDDLILVTGSLYLVGEVRKFLISNMSFLRKQESIH